MRIKDFVEKYNTAKDKEKFVKKHITKEYVSYLNKVALCDRVIQASCYKEVMDKRVFVINRPAQFVLFIMSIIYEYTDLDEGVDVIIDFDFLDQHGLIEGIVQYIPDGEYQTLQAILEMMIDDIGDNERSLTAYLDNKLNALGVTMDSLADVLNEYLSGVNEDGGTQGVDK